MTFHNAPRQCTNALLGATLTIIAVSRSVFAQTHEENLAVITRGSAPYFAQGRPIKGAGAAPPLGSFPSNARLCATSRNDTYIFFNLPEVGAVYSEYSGSTFARDPANDRACGARPSTAAPPTDLPPIYNYDDWVRATIHGVPSHQPQVSPEVTNPENRKQTDPWEDFANREYRAKEAREAREAQAKADAEEPERQRRQATRDAIIAKSKQKKKDIGDSVCDGHGNDGEVEQIHKDRVQIRIHRVDPGSLSIFSASTPAQHYDTLNWYKYNEVYLCDDLPPEALN